jgi:hypothetical protein
MLQVPALSGHLSMIITKGPMTPVFMPGLLDKTRVQR